MRSHAIGALRMLGFPNIAEGTRGPAGGVPVIDEQRRRVSGARA
jgi:hypothetical protein